MMGYFSELDIERSCLSNDHSYTDPAWFLREKIDELKCWLRWYGCEFVDNEDFECICNGYIFEERIHEYIHIPTEAIRYQADALRELGWCYYKLRRIEGIDEDRRDADATEAMACSVHQLTVFNVPKCVKYYPSKAA